MQVAQSGSWQFREADSQILHVALYARDVAGLHVATSADIPPKLAGDLSRLNGLTSEDERALAGRQWRTWWSKLLRYAASDAQRRWTEDYSDFAGLLDGLRQRQEDVFDPPRFATLAEMPALQDVVAAAFDPALNWLNHRAGPGEHTGALSWEAVQSAAEHVATDRGVPVGELRATVQVLTVDGVWSYMAAPGFALCSAALAVNPDAAWRFLEEVFASSAP